ncbi:MAG: dephospho-CoA kinase [Treponema sp.]|uniref:dephospho-CoA kinase n=1 Tax=Treponema sp. TaxID=166 RepID=UPI003FA240F7
MESKKNNLIGLAGQSCAGKNVVADFLAGKGFYVIDADIVAHQVLSEEQNTLVTLFEGNAEKKGLKLRQQDGQLDRKALSALLFDDPALLAVHEAFILPKIEQRIRNLIRNAESEAPARPIVLNAPTLHKTHLVPECSFILYITAPFLLRLIRAKKRDKRPLRQLIARFMQQRKFFTQYLAQNADIVSVRNTHSVYSLRNKIEQVLRKKGF